MDFQLDLTAYRCPLPLLMTQKALQQLQLGQRLCVRLNENATLNDFITLSEALAVSLQFEPSENGFRLNFQK